MSTIKMPVNPEKAPEPNEIDVMTLQRNLSKILTSLVEHRYQNLPPAKLVAVTKTVSPNAIQMLKPLRVMDIGENRVQAALPKMTKISPEFRLHWIGRLQTNKVKDIIEHVYMLHSMDRVSLAQEVDRRAGMCGRILQTLIQVNIAEEPQKAGLCTAEIKPFLQKLKTFPNISVKGLMAMMPLDAEEDKLTVWFKAMRKLFESLREESIEGIGMEELSMGMTNDYIIAAREGATMVRIGTALFQHC